MKRHAFLLPPAPASCLLLYDYWYLRRDGIGEDDGGEPDFGFGERR